MKRDSRLSVALHALLHMAETEGAVTSEMLGPRMEVHPVVLRRTMAGLREAGIVRSEKGHGGGWTLARPLDGVTLADVYAALGTPAPFSIGPRAESPGCLVEQAVNRALAQALDEAQARLLSQLRRVTLADLAKDVRKHGWPHAHTKKGTKGHA